MRTQPHLVDIGQTVQCRDAVVMGFTYENVRQCKLAGKEGKT